MTGWTIFLFPFSALILGLLVLFVNRLSPEQVSQSEDQALAEAREAREIARALSERIAELEARLEQEASRHKFYRNVRPTEINLPRKAVRVRQTRLAPAE